MRNYTLGLHLAHLKHLMTLQVPISELPPYNDVLEPLLPLPGAKPIHTRDFKDGQEIPTLSELLEAVSSTAMHVTMTQHFCCGYNGSTALKRHCS